MANGCKHCSCSGARAGPPQRQGTRRARTWPGSLQQVSQASQIIRVAASCITSHNTSSTFLLHPADLHGSLVFIVWAPHPNIFSTPRIRCLHVHSSNVSKARASGTNIMSETSALFAMHAGVGSQIGRATRTWTSGLIMGPITIQPCIRGQADCQREPDCLANCMQHV